MDNFCFMWPYAAKAIVEHEFIDDHLNVWLTFHLPMCQLHTPLITTWIVTLDGTTYPATVQTWQDAFTLLLLVPAVPAAPTRTLVSYAGPDVNLHTSWHKQWEPWGPILSHPLT